MNNAVSEPELFEDTDCANNAVSKPKTYKDKDCANQRYFFVSYSHRDIDLVYPTLSKLFDCGVNYWYDTELDPGDRWSERVARIIDDENCVGSILFLSENSLVSDAVCKEVKYMLPKQSNDFRIVPIILGHSDSMSLLFKVSKTYANFYTTNFDMFKDITSIGLCTLFENAVIEIEKLAKKFNVMDQYLINARDSLLTEFDSKTYNGKRTMLCGKYPFNIDEKEEDITWTLIERSGNEYVFVSEYCIDFVNYNEVADLISNLKTQIQDKGYVADISLINESFIKRHAELTNSLPTDYADKHRNQVLRVFWVLNGDGKGCEYCLYNSLNVKINERIDHDSINAGVRLLLTAKNDKIRSN